MKQLMSFLTFFLSMFYIMTPLHAEGENMKNPAPLPMIDIETNLGTFTVTLRPDIAPKASENFLQHARNGYYDNLIFHRVIKGFMIQGGDPTGTGRGGTSIWNAPFEDEVSDQVTFDRPGLLAMANAGPKTNGSQFFITTVPTPWLNKRHTIFGSVTQGYEIVQRISEQKTAAADRPVEPIRILHMKVRESASSSTQENKQGE